VDAAEVVGNSASRLAIEPLEGISALIDASLLHRDGESDGEPRFGMLETIREFALERLAASGEEATVRGAHAASLLALAEQAEPSFFVPGQERWLGRLETEHENLRAALGWFDQTGDAERCLRLAGALRFFWYGHSHYVEGHRWLERALAQGNGLSPALLAKALNGLGRLALFQGDLARAEPLLAKSLALYRHLGDRSALGEANTLSLLGLVASGQGNYEDATMRTETALARLRELTGRDPTAPPLTGAALAHLGLFAYWQGDYAQATVRLEEALALQRELGFAWGMILSLWGLGNVALAQGDEERAARHYRESLALAREHGDNRYVAHALAGIAGVAAAWGQPERAARLLGAAEALHETIGVPIFPANRVAFEREVAAVRVALDEDAFGIARTAGRALTLDQAVAEAEATFAALSATGADRPAVSAPRAGLTVRELEVLRLVAEGLTDRQIADALFVSRRTATSHLTNILAKLGLENRAAAAAYAVRHGLV
jgi:non-specific serine/threonine protein kinase